MSTQLIIGPVVHRVSINPGGKVLITSKARGDAHLHVVCADCGFTGESLVKACRVAGLTDGDAFVIAHNLHISPPAELGVHDHYQRMGQANRFSPVPA